MERHHSSNAKRKNVGSFGNEVVKSVENSGNVLEEEPDLDKVDVIGDGNIIASDIDVNTSHDNDDDGDTDAQYKSRMGCSKGTIKQEYSHLTENLEVFQYDSKWMRRLKRRSIASEMECHHSSNAKRKNVGSFGDKVVKSAENSGNVLEEELDLDKVDVIGDGNIVGSDIDVNTSHDSDNDNDGNNLIYMPENGVAVVYGEECDQSSIDFEPIILHPSQHYEDSPFICSEICLADERNHKDSLYRKGLMEELERPYDQKELDELLQVASHERTKQPHREMHNGVTKDRAKGGDDNKTSYLKMHSACA